MDHGGNRPPKSRLGRGGQAEGTPPEDQIDIPSLLMNSRPFLSFPSHEYFRRILGNLIGSEADRGELPDDFDALAGLVRAVCFGNAKRHFGFDV